MDQRDGSGIRAPTHAPRRRSDRAEPYVEYDGTITLAGDHPRLRAIAAALAARTAWADAAVDALAAHVITVLDVALTVITDATEFAAPCKLIAAPPDQ